MIMNLKQRKIKFKPRIKLNHNICLVKIATVTVFTNQELLGAFEVISYLTRR